MSTNAKWVSVSLSVPPEVNQIVTGVGTLLSTVSTLLEVISSILDIIKVFLIDLDNPLTVLVNALLAIIDKLIADFVHSGLYMYIDGPKSQGDNANLLYYGQNLQGGMEEWRSRMAYALYNSGDANRPQFSNSASVISFHLVVTSGDLGHLMTDLGFLINMIGDRMLPNMNPPRALTIRPVNTNFYTKFYDTTTGLISTDKINAYGREVTQFGFIPDELGGNLLPTNALDLGNIKGKLGYDLLTGEEIIIDKGTGACIAHSLAPNASLITWKTEPTVIPFQFVLEKDTIKGGTMEVTSRVDGSGAVIATNLLVPDSTGRPQHTYAESITLGANELGTLKTSISGQHAYLDTDVQQGLAYYYRMRSKLISDPKEIIVPDMNLSIPVLRNINGYLLTLKDLMSGVSAPCEEVSVYIPNPGDTKVMYDLFQKADEATELPWLSHYRGNGGWTRISTEPIARPLILVLNEIKNFVEAYLASIQSGVAEIVGFIELLQTKINTLNTFIEVLQAIVALLDAMSLVQFGCLFVTTDNGLQGVLSAVNDSNLPGVPNTGSDDYVGSVTILGGTAGAGAALNALQVLFGLS